jgi:hypothetical protein
MPLPVNSWNRGGSRSLPLLLLLSLLLSLSLSTATLLACRYNVRDVGFVDLETEAYRLHLLIQTDTPAEALALLQQLPTEVLRDSNVQCEIVDASVSPNHPAIGALPRSSASTFPRAVLVSPDDQALPLALTQPGRPFRESLTSALTEVATSPTRDALLTTVCSAFAAVLLIEGQSADANARARQAIALALEAIRTQMPSLPKAIAAPPGLVVLEAAALATEQILLWSLGLDLAPTSSPRAVLVYGRARWFGPVMHGDEISEANLTRLLSIVGADCECGLDAVWTLGTRLPVRWDEARHAQAVKSLGFDPEHPLVRVEVSRIAGRTGSRRAPSPGLEDVVLAGDPLPGPRTDHAPGSVPPAREDGVAIQTPAPPATASANAPILSRALLFLSGLTVCLLAVGAFLLWRGRS